jgi:transcription initiation factor TFIIA large subunit
MSHSTEGTYQSVIHDVINKVRQEFLNAGYEESALRELQQLWESKLAISPAVGSQQQFAHQYGVNYADPNTFNAAALMLPGTNPLLLMQSHMGTGADQVQQQLATGTAAYANIKTEHGKGLQPVLANTTGQPLQYIPGSMTGTAASLTRTNSTGTSQASLTNSLQSILNTPGNPTINNTPIAPDAVPGMLNNNQLLTASNPIVMTTAGGLINPISGGTKTFQLANGRAISVPNTPGAPTLPPIQVANNINSNLQQHATNPSNWSEGTKATKKGNKRAKVVDEGLGDDEELNSDDDELGSDLDDDEDKEPETDNIVICLFEKVTRVRSKRKAALRDGVMHLNGRDYLFQKANGEFDW